MFTLVFNTYFYFVFARRLNSHKQNTWIKLKSVCFSFWIFLLLFLFLVFVIFTVLQSYNRFLGDVQTPNTCKSSAHFAKRHRHAKRSRRRQQQNVMIDDLLHIFIFIYTRTHTLIGVVWHGVVVEPRVEWRHCIFCPYIYLFISIEYDEWYFLFQFMS